MIIGPTIKNLKSLYEILDIIYLSDFFKKDGEKRLYESLKSCHRDRFENHQRILIIQDCVDTYEYEDMPGKAITTLQKYLWEIDISNCFVLVLTTNQSIKDELDLAQQIYSNDRTSIEFQILDGEYTKTQELKDAFCILPWVHVYVGPQGDVLPCCQGDRLFPLGNINERSMKSIMTSDSSNRLRADMLQGKRTKECANCWAQEDSGLASLRMMSNKRYSDHMNKVNRQGVINDFRPAYLDIRLSNLCNFKCRMCDEYYSSAIAQESMKIYNKATPMLDRSLKKETVKEVLDFLPTVEKIYFAGGEPLLSPEHYDILDALITCGNTNLEIKYNTNFSTLSFKDRSVLDIWKKFSDVTVSASLDAMGPVAEYVRFGTIWTEIEKNRSLLQQQVPVVNLTVASVLGFMNVRSLIELQRTWHEQGKLDITKFSLTTMISPNHLTLRMLPVDHKNTVEEIVRTHIEWCEKNNAKSLADQWDKSLKYMWDKDDSQFLSEFKRITRVLDQHRSQSFVDIFPEYADLYD